MSLEEGNFLTCGDTIVKLIKELDVGYIVVAYSSNHNIYNLDVYSINDLEDMKYVDPDILDNLEEFLKFNNLNK